MMFRRPAGCVAWRREDWPSCQAARHILRAFWTSPFGPVLSVRIPSAHRLDRQPVCLRRWSCGLRTDRAGDTHAKWIRASCGLGRASYPDNF